MTVLILIFAVCALLAVVICLAAIYASNHLDFDFHFEEPEHTLEDDIKQKHE